MDWPVAATLMLGFPDEDNNTNTNLKILSHARYTTNFKKDLNNIQNLRDSSSDIQIISHNANLSGVLWVCYKIGVKIRKYYI